MSLFKCKMCGGDLEIAEGVTIAECEYCGTNQTVPKAMDDNMQNLFNRANTLRIKSEFDKAEKLYEKIIQADSTQSEAYWGLILCKYGIEYVDDPATFKKIPTCYRASYESIIADDDYKSALANADMSQRAVYEEQAREIDRIQKEILALAQKEETYDVFICYKETDADGRRTQDSVIANDIYYQLKNEGFKVFYAAITLEGKLGSAYEPIIFAALNSAKVMLAIGTKPEYFNAVWVKNEWSRYLKIVAKDRSKLLIPCYRDMDAYELPEEFAHLQAQDMGKIGFINDLVRGIKKVVKKDEPKQSTVVKETVVTTANATVAPLLKRAFMFLEDGDWTSANEYCEKVLDLDPECAEAYLGKLMAELKVKNREKLMNQPEPFDGDGNYQKAVRFADDTLKTELTGYIDHIKTRNQKTRLEEVYNKALKAMSEAVDTVQFSAAARMFEGISNYKDSCELAKKCRESAIITRKDQILGEAKSRMGGNVYALEKAIDLLNSIKGWKNADNLIIECHKKIEELEAKAEAERCERERKAEIARIEAEKKAKLIKKIAIITTPIVCAVIAFIIVLNVVILPSINNVKLQKIFDEQEDELKNVFSVGDTIKFGAYEQDNNIANGKEEIEWLVLAKEGNKALLISKYALDCKPYNTKFKDATWEKCTLRKWLNDDFIKSAFSFEAQSMIPTVTVSADKNQSYSTNPGNATQDKVFLLSITEVNKYFTSDEARKCAHTDYAIAQGAWTSDSYKVGGRATCWWWLRSPGNYQTGAAIVGNDGDVDERGYSVNLDDFAVRPALWIDLNS